MISKLVHKMANLSAVKRLLTENRFFVRHYFNWRYRAEDPYDLDKSEYEHEKFERTVAAISSTVSGSLSALEIGCGEGRLTERLSGLSGKVLAVDISDFATGRAKTRLKGLNNVTVRRADVFADPLGEEYDLVVCSEVLFYFEKAQLPEVTSKVFDLVADGGSLVLIHARTAADDDVGVELKSFGAKTIHDTFIQMNGFNVAFDDNQPEYRITILEKSR